MSVDLLTMAAGIGVSALIQALVGFAVWLLIRRNIEKVDRLEQAVNDLENDKVQRIADDLEKHAAEDNRRFEGESISRKKIHEDITEIKTHFVHVKTCQKQHETFTVAVTDLAKVQERTENVTKMLDALNGRMVGMVQDIAAVQAVQDERGKQDAPKGGRPR
jgi:hypothetical protein